MKIRNIIGLVTAAITAVLFIYMSYVYVRYHPELTQIQMILAYREVYITAMITAVVTLILVR